MSCVIAISLAIRWKGMGEITLFIELYSKNWISFPSPSASYWFTGWTLDSYKSILQAPH
jgi:hypothetical protein